MKKWMILALTVAVVSCGGSGSKDPAAQKKELPAELKEQIQEAAHEEEKQKPLDPSEIVPPLQAIKDLDKKIENYHLGQNLKAEQVEENLKLKKQIIRGTFDIKELCRLSLGKHWEPLSQKQKDHFVGLMTTLLETKAIFSKEQLRGENKLYSINYKKETYDDAKKTKSTVTTIMSVPKEKLKLDITYKLILTPYGWKIFDVIVDGASTLSNYKFQFDRIIQKQGFDNLITRMETKLKKISKPK